MKIDPKEEPPVMVSRVPDDWTMREKVQANTANTGRAVDLTRSAPTAAQLDAARRLSTADRETRIHALELELIALRAEPYVEYPKMVTNTHDHTRHLADSADHEKALTAKPKDPPKAKA